MCEVKEPTKEDIVKNMNSLYGTMEPDTSNRNPMYTGIYNSGYNPLGSIVDTMLKERRN